MTTIKTYPSVSQYDTELLLLSLLLRSLAKIQKTVDSKKVEHTEAIGINILLREDQTTQNVLIEEQNLEPDT